LCQDWRVKAASKLHVPVEEVEVKLKELEGRRVFIHYRGEPPSVEGVKALRIFKDMGVMSAVCSYEGLRKLVALDAVEAIEPVPRARALGGFRTPIPGEGEEGEDGREE